MKKHISKIALSLALVSTIIIGCKKDEKLVPETTIEATTQSMSLKMDAYVGSNALDYTSSFTTSSNIRHTISNFRYYVSNIRLIKSDDTEYKIEDKYLLVDATKSNYDLGQIPFGEYKGLKFDVGIDSITNHSDPSIYSTNNPLAIQSPGMHWSWNSGYIFVMVEGSVDTTTSNNDVLTLGQYSKSMFIHLGMDRFRKEVDLSSSPFSVTSSGATIVNIKADLDTFFNTIDLKTNNQTHTMDNMSLAMKAAGNISSMFSVVQ